MSYYVDTKQKNTNTQSLPDNFYEFLFNLKIQAHH